MGRHGNDDFGFDRYLGFDGVTSRRKACSFFRTSFIVLIVQEQVEGVSFDLDRPSSTFETTIRVVGGLLAAYDLTKEEVYLKKAKDMGDRLLPAFNTPVGYPKV